MVKKHRIFPIPLVTIENIGGLECFLQETNQQHVDAFIKIYSMAVGHVSVKLKMNLFPANALYRHAIHQHDSLQTEPMRIWVGNRITLMTGRKTQPSGPV